MENKPGIGHELDAAVSSGSEAYCVFALFEFFVIKAPSEFRGLMPIIFENLRCAADVPPADKGLLPSKSHNQKFRKIQKQPAFFDVHRILHDFRLSRDYVRRNRMNNNNFSPSSRSEGDEGLSKIFPIDGGTRGWQKVLQSWNYKLIQYIFDLG